MLATDAPKTRVHCKMKTRTTHPTPSELLGLSIKEWPGIMNQCSFDRYCRCSRRACSCQLLIWIDRRLGRHGVVFAVSKEVPTCWNLWNCHLNQACACWKRIDCASNLAVWPKSSSTSSQLARKQCDRVGADSLFRLIPGSHESHVCDRWCSASRRCWLAWWSRSCNPAMPRWSWYIHTVIISKYAWFMGLPSPWNARFLLLCYHARIQSSDLHTLSWIDQITSNIFSSSNTAFHSSQNTVFFPNSIRRGLTSVWKEECHCFRSATQPFDG